MPKVHARATWWAIRGFSKIKFERHGIKRDTPTRDSQQSTHIAELALWWFQSPRESAGDGIWVRVANGTFGALPSMSKVCLVLRTPSLAAITLGRKDQFADFSGVWQRLRDDVVLTTFRSSSVLYYVLFGWGTGMRAQKRGARQSCVVSTWRSDISRNEQG